MASTSVHSAFWTGRTGRAMRDLPSEVRDTALYLLTGPDANAFGLFTVEPETIARMTGRKEKAIREALDHLGALGFCRWDDASGWVWVLEMAHYQFQTPLKQADYRCGAAKKWYRGLLRNPFLGEWWDRYASDFHFGADPHPEERRASYRTGAIPGAGAPPSKGQAQPRTEVQDPKILGTSLFEDPNDLLHAREGLVPVNLALQPLSKGGVEDSFERIWSAHPNGKQKKDALIEWRKLKLTPALLEQIETSHRAHVASHDWQKEAQRFCPRLVNWIKKQGWLDRVDARAPVIVSAKNQRNIEAAQAAASRAPFTDDEDYPVDE